MFDKVTLGIRGDLNFLKKRIMENPNCIPAVSFAPSGNQNGNHYIYFEANDDLYLLDQFLNVLAEYIIDRYEAQMLKRLLHEDYPTLSPAQKREVLRGAELYTDDPEIGYSARKQAVLLSLYDYLREDSVMLLDGFVAFRLKEYESMLENMSERLVDGCITQREYEDFISLLKYFVNIQESRPSLTHVVVTVDERYELLSESGENITGRCLSDFVDCNDIPENANFDDLLISMLITLAPESIMVHNADQIRNKELFQTIRRVFDGRLAYCTGCDLCAAKSATTTTQV